MASMNEFDESIELAPAGLHEWTSRADPRRESTTGMFGGWSAALLLKAVRSDAVDAGSPVSLSVHFLNAVIPGSALTVRTRPLGESFGFTDAVMPEAPPPDALPTFHPPGTFGQRSLARPVHGFPIFDRTDSRAVLWVRETSGRAIDAIQLAYLADNYPPRSWSRRTEPGPYSTITLSAYFHATDAELAALGDDDVLLDVSSSRAESSTVAAHARIWSRGGVLLATTEQLGWFR